MGTSSPGMAHSTTPTGWALVRKSSTSGGGTAVPAIAPAVPSSVMLDKIPENTLTGYCPIIAKLCTVDPINKEEAFVVKPDTDGDG